MLTKFDEKNIEFFAKSVECDYHEEYDCCKEVCLYVYSEDGVDIGIIGWYKYRGDNINTTIGILPEFRGKGYFKKMYKEMMDTVLKPPFYIGIDDDNVNSLRSHNKYLDLILYKKYKYSIIYKCRGMKVDI